MATSSPIERLPILAELQRTGKLHGIQSRAAFALAVDHRNADGRSLPISRYDDMPRSPSVNLEGRQWHTEAQDRLHRLEEYLRPHERALLGQVCFPDAKPWERIISLGAGSGYKQAEQMRAAGVAYVQSLLLSVGAFYLSISELPFCHIPAFETPNVAKAA